MASSRSLFGFGILEDSKDMSFKPIVSEEERVASSGSMGGRGRFLLAAGDIVLGGSFGSCDIILKGGGYF